MEQKIGFIGLGMMGLPMAKNLIKKGYALTVLDTNPEAMKSIEDAGAREASSPAQLASQSQIIITMLPSTPHVQEVASGKNGVLEGMQKGSIFIDMSTILPTASRELATQFKKAGYFMLDAPVSRGQKAAIEGTLSIMVGGEKEAFDRSRNIFEAMGTDIIYCGPSGNGAVVKLVNNLLGGIIALANCEALVMGVKGGVDLETILKVIQVSSGNSWLLENIFPRMVFNGSFQPGFKLDLMKKDLTLVHDFALSQNTPLFLGTLAEQLYELAHMKGMGALDFTAVMQTLEDMAQVRVRYKKNE